MLHFAYLDGTQGSLILQTIAATGLGAVYVVRHHIRHFFGRFRKGSSSEKSNQD